jgi:hypothetical protein
MAFCLDQFELAACLFGRVAARLAKMVRAASACRNSPSSIATGYPEVRANKSRYDREPFSVWPIG